MGAEWDVAILASMAPDVPAVDPKCIIAEG